MRLSDDIYSISFYFIKQKGLICLCILTTSTEHCRRLLRKRFNATNIYAFGSISTHTSTSLPSWFSPRDTDPNNLNDLTPNLVLKSSAWDTIRDMYSSLVFISLLLLSCTVTKVIKCFKQTKPAQTFSHAHQIGKRSSALEKMHYLCLKFNKTSHSL